MRLEAEYSKKDLANYNLPRFGPPLLKTRLLSLLSTKKEKKKKEKKKTKYVTLLRLELTLSKWNNMSSMQIIGPHTSCWSGMKN